MLIDQEIVPRIEAVIPRTVKPVGLEDVEEVTQDAIAMAAGMLDSVKRSGKEVAVGRIACDRLQHIKSGRGSCGEQHRHVLASGRVNQNVLPLPTSLSIPIFPPWASMASLQKASPKPVEYP